MEDLTNLCQSIPLKTLALQTKFNESYSNFMRAMGRPEIQQSTKASADTVTSGNSVSNIHSLIKNLSSKKRATSKQPKYG